MGAAVNQRAQYCDQPGIEDNIKSRRNYQKLRTSPPTMGITCCGY
jgi:hypothetical protein